MDKEMYESLEKLKFIWLKELCSYSEKKADTQTFRDGKELAEAIKDLCKVMHMMKEDGMAESYRSMSMRGGMSYDGRDGGYSVNRGSYGGYSGHQSDAEYMNHLYMLLDKAPNDMARAQIAGLIRESEGRR